MIPYGGGTLHNTPSVAQGVSLVQFFEACDSSFKRSFLYGISISSNTLALVPEYVGGGSKTHPVLTSFSVDEEQFASSKQSFIYSPSGGFRFFHLQTQAPVKNINLSVTYIGRDQISRPLPVPPATSAQVKLMFRRIQ